MKTSKKFSKLNNSTGRNFFRLEPVQLIPLSFLITILVGAGLLLLPFSTVQGESTDFLTALFTSATSVCVTGLVVVDTYAHWSLFGQVVILLLIQVGGLGIITVISTLMILLRKKFTLSDRTLLQDALNFDTNRGLLSFLIRIVRGTLLVEGIGALLYCLPFIRDFGMIGIWYAVFNSISAFCNAGIDIMGPDSLIGYQKDPFVLIVTMILIVLGGIGYVVWFDITSRKKEDEPALSMIQRFKRLNEHTKLVVCLTLGLIVFGAFVLLITEYNNPLTIGDMSFGDKILNSFFESVTLRTAGFAAIPQQNYNSASCIFSYILMFIGGSPIGTAGGVKTVTVFLMLMNALSYIRNRKDTVIFKRKISDELMHKSSAIVQVSFIALTVLTFILILTNPVSIQDGLFEIVSATATVGLSRGVTPNLNEIGKMIVVFAMFLGRIGPISMAVFWVNQKEDKSKLKYSVGRFYVG